MDLRNVDLNLLAVLEVLLQEQSVTKAAMRIGRSQPAMSRALARLRETFDDPLFVVVGRSLVPTPRAEELQVQLASVLDDIRNLMEPAGFDPAKATNTFRINAPDATVYLMLGKFLARVAAEAPSMNVAISSAAGSQLAALEAGDIDLAVDTFIDAPSGFHRQSLFESPLVAVVRAGHPALDRTFDAGAFVSWPHVWVDTATSRALDAQLAQRDINRRVSVRVSSFFTGAVTVEQTDYIMVLPKEVAARAAEMADVVILPLPVAMPRLTLDQLWHPRLQHDPSHIWLRGAIAETARSKD